MAQSCRNVLRSLFSVVFHEPVQTTQIQRNPDLTFLRKIMIESSNEHFKTN